MWKIVEGNILDAEAEALVNTVNTVGVMGKGIALQFKKAFPEMFAEYERICKEGKFAPGQMHVFDRGGMFNPRYIINFPTKKHWKGKSRIADIESGLDALVEEIKVRRIRSIAIPPLGCGNGGLDWDDVRPLIERALERVPEVEAAIHAPKESTLAAEMVAGLSAFCDALEAGEPIEKRFRVRTVALEPRSKSEPIRSDHLPGADLPPTSERTR